MYMYTHIYVYTYKYYVNAMKTHMCVYEKKCTHKLAFTCFIQQNYTALFRAGTYSHRRV